MSCFSVRRRSEARIANCVSHVHDALRRVSEKAVLNAFVETWPAEAASAAALSDSRIASGMPGTLDGMIVGVKDNIAVEGHVCSAASHMLRDYTSPYDATVIRRLRDAGAVLLGRTNMDEFAMGSSGENSVYGPTLNPRFPGRVSGGSSSGSAVAVAAGLVDVALGSDTGGSIRLPAAYTGTVGMKPTYGRVSRSGLVAFASSFDQIGPISGCVEDNAALLAVIAGRDDSDATTTAHPVGDYITACTADVHGMRVGVLYETKEAESSEYAEASLRDTVQLLRAAGVACVPAHIEHQHLLMPAYLVIANVEAAGNLARYDGVRYGRRGASNDLSEMYSESRGEGFGSEVVRRLLLGTWVQDAGIHDEHYRRALRARGLVLDAWLQTLNTVDALLSPVTLVPPFAFGERRHAAAGMYSLDQHTVAANLTGLPAIAVPITDDEHGNPRSVQITAAPFAEATLYSIGAAIERLVMEGGIEKGRLWS